MEELNLQQKETLDKFRQDITNGRIQSTRHDLETDDITLLRFLRARNFNLKAAKTMYTFCNEWRRTVGNVGIDELYRRTDPYDYPERKEVFSKWPIWYHKTDKKGRPINIQTFGAINIPELHKVVSPERHWETIVVNAESGFREVFPAASAEKGETVSSSLSIIDLKGFGLSQFWGMKGLVRDCFQITQDYYPESLGQLLVINAPSTFTIIWSGVKPWLAKETVAKVDILGSNYKEVLLGIVDAENLPSTLGGTCTCEGLGGCEFSSAGPWMEGRKERRRAMYPEGSINGDASASTQLNDNEPNNTPHNVEMTEHSLPNGTAMPGKE